MFQVSHESQKGHEEELLLSFLLLHVWPSSWELLDLTVLVNEIALYHQRHRAVVRSQLIHGYGVLHVWL